MTSLPGAPEQRAAAIQRLVVLRGRQPTPVQGLMARVRQLVVLASSSRGGSSVMAEILRNSRHLLHLRAEVNPFLVLSGHSWPESGCGSDLLGAAQLRDQDTLEHLLARDIGRPTGTLPHPQDVKDFARELHWRLSLQWPLELFDASWVHDQVRHTLQLLEQHHGWARGTFPDTARFHALFLARVRTRHPQVNPWYYDLPPRLVRQHHPQLEPSLAPPSPVVLEEPPFVTVSPWQAPTSQDLEQLPLVIKTPSNAYRLPFLAAAFPNATLRVLHLTRNAAASVNGLVDGWRFRGFFAHQLDTTLDISGYSAPEQPWSQSWWKFDLPPGWDAWSQRPLVEVCGFQWRSAHTAVLDWLAANPQVPALRLPFERVVGSHDERLEAFSSLAQWLGLPGDPTLERLVSSGLPPIMATSRPRHRRWYERVDLLEPVLARADTRALMDELGYAPDPATWS